TGNNSSGDATTFRLTKGRPDIRCTFASYTNHKLAATSRDDKASHPNRTGIARGSTRTITGIVPGIFQLRVTAMGAASACAAPARESARVRADAGRLHRSRESAGRTH